MNIDLSGKWALVTGAGSGIGRGCAQVFAECGANVAVNDIDAGAAEKTVAMVKKLGRQSIVLVGDVGDESAVAAMYNMLARSTDKLHILINNAGFNMFKGIADTTPAEWDRIMQVDLRGIYLMTKAALPMLKAAKTSSVISIASVHAHATVPHLTAYAAAKAASSPSRAASARSSARWASASTRSAPASPTPQSWSAGLHRSPTPRRP
jgi:NAD(P)-dependent dehydrogenase (short-subunit alcohol dehydrogenase family)